MKEKQIHFWQICHAMLDVAHILRGHLQLCVYSHILEKKSKFNAEVIK